MTASVLGSGMAFLDSTAVNVALPVLGADLGADFAGFQWVINAYLLTLAAFMLVGGALGDRFGRRRVFVVGVAAFGGTSILCGLAPNLAALMAFRALQGLAAALLVPGSLAMIQAGFHADDRGRAIGLWSGFSGLATLAGPLLGGWLVDTVSWRAIFLVNPVLAVATVVFALRYVPRDPGEGSDAGSPDYGAAVAAALAVGGVVFAVIQGPEWGWGDPRVIGAGTVGLVAGALFPWVESRAARPMLPLRFFRRRRFVAANALTLVVYGVLGATFFLLMIQLQRVMGYGALEAGAAGAPITLLLLVLSPLAGRMADRLGPRIPLTAGPLVAGAGVALLTRADAGASYWWGVLPGIAVFGVGLGLTVAPITATALGALEERYSGVASGVNNAAARFAQLTAVAVLPLAAGISGVDRLSGPAFSSGFDRAMWIGAAALVVAALVSWTTIRGPLQEG